MKGSNASFSVDNVAILPEMCAGFEICFLVRVCVCVRVLFHMPPSTVESL